MSYTITQLKTDLQGMLHGTSLSKVQGVDDLIARAGRDLLLDVDPYETKRTQQITNALYDKVYNYAAPTDLKGNKVIAIRPQVNNSPENKFGQSYSENFDRYKVNGSFVVESNSGTKTIRISKDLIPGLLINECDSTTANGTWSVGSGASNLTADTVYKVTGSASLNFDLSTTGYIENSTMDQVDLSDHDEISSIFVWVYMPTTVTNVILRWGNDTSNYWSSTVTQAFDGAFQVGWNLLQFDWSSATETGTVDPETIDYIRVTLTYSGSADTDFRVDSIISKLPSIYEIEYYSKFLFKTSAGVWQETVTDDSNIVNLDTDAYNLLLNKCMVLAAPQVQGTDSLFDLKTYKDEYTNGVTKYKATYKSEVSQPQQTYYRF